MLSPYARSYSVVKYTDTSTMLSPYQRSFSAVKYTDTATMLSGYKTYYPRNAISAGTGISYNASTGVITNSSPSTGGTVTSIATNANTGITGGTITGSGTIAADTLLLSTRAWRQKGIDSVSQNVNLRVKYTDTATMLSPYLRSATATATYQPLENQRLSTTNSPSFQTITTLAGGSNPLGKNISIGDDVFLADRNIANTIYLKGLPDSTKGFISFGGDANTLGYDGTKMSYGGSFTASSLIKSGGTSAQILAADGSVITAGTNITISGGTISASGGGGSGTVTSIATNNGSGITGGTITTSGTLAADTVILATRLRVQKGIDSLGGIKQANLSLSAIGSTANANGATLTGAVLNLEPASASFGGVVTTSAQTFAGIKSFTASATASGAIARGTYFNPTLTAAANGDILAAIDINPTFSTGAFTGVSSLAGRFNGNVVVGTVPSNISAFTFPPLTLSNNATGATKVQLALINGGGSVGAGSAIDFFTYTDQGNGNPGVRIISTDDGVFSGNFQIQTKAQGGSGTGALSTKFTITGGSGAATFSSSVASTSFNSTTGGNFATSSGNIGIGTTTVGSKFQVNGNAAIGYSSSTAAPTNGLAVAGGVTIGTATNNVSSIAASGYSLTGANAQSLVDLSGTWNTTGNPTAIFLNLTNTASGATANLMDLQVGGSSKFLVDKGGAATHTGQVTITSTSGTVAGARNALYLKNAASTGGQSSIIVFGSAGTASSWQILNDINADGTTINQLDILNNGTTRMSIASTGAATFSNLAGTGSRMVVADASGTLSAASIVTSGTYTPTITNYSNTSALSINSASYIRVGNTVIVTVYFNFSTAVAALSCGIYFTIPSGNNFSSTSQARGQGAISGTVIVNSVSSVTSSNTVLILFTNTQISTQSGTITFQYDVQ